MAGVDGRVSLITGGSRGIGLATAQLMASRGAKVMCVARNEEELAATGAGEVHVIGAYGGLQEVEIDGAVGGVGHGAGGQPPHGGGAQRACV